MHTLDIGLVLRASLIVIVRLSGPPLLTGLVVGILVSLFQTVMQISEPTLTFVPKVIAIGAVLVMTGSYIAIVLTNYGQLIFDQLVAVGGQ